MTGGSPPAAPVEQSAGGARAVLTVLLLVVILGQRFALPVPGFELQLTLVAGLATLALLVRRGAVRPDRFRLQLYGTAAVAVSATAFLAAYLSAWIGGPLSVPSWMVLLALWVMFVYRLHPGAAGEYRHFALTFVRVMVVLAGVGAAQFAAQYAGVWRYRDLISALVPPDLLISGYNTSIPLQFGSEIYKANAFVFLEPSFLSQYCALALIVAVVLRAPVWQLGVLGLGLMSAVSGTGLLLVAVGAVLALLRVPGLIRPGHLVTAAVGLLLALASPVGALLLARRGEFVQSGSSGYKRFVAPYLEVAEGLAQEPLRYLVGAGPGTATRLLESSARGQYGQAIVYNIPTKLLFEYGLVAGAVFTVFVLAALLHRGPVPVVPGALVFMLFILSGSLLQPHTVVLAWLLTGLWSSSGTSVGRRPPGNAEPARVPARASPPAAA